MTRLQRDLYADRYAKVVEVVEFALDFVGTTLAGSLLVYAVISGFFPA